jgi:site-specific DNA recombinase
MARDFRARFLGEMDIYSDLPHPRSLWLALVMGYVRYSDDNSNPRSLDQQLKLQLGRARQNNHLLPWSLVFADAAVTATSADRHGYELVKEALLLDAVKVLYIDEIGRASRDLVEALRLGRLVKQQKKRLFGVSDGFDSDSEMAKWMLSISGTMQEWFVDQLRSKVRRGKDDAFDRGTNLAPPPVGYDLVPATDADDRPMLGKGGDQLNMKSPNKDLKEVLEAFLLFGPGGKSPNYLARKFNGLGVGGSTSWSDVSIRNMLRRRTYAGIEIYNRTYQTRDPDTGQVTTHERPRKEWKVRRARHLQIVPWWLWKVVQRRLEACKTANGKPGEPGAPTRSEVYPTVLVRPVCGSCGANHYQTRTGDGGKYSSFYCKNSTTGTKGCTYRGSKTVRIVEETILGELRGKIFTAAFVGRVLEHANAFLAEEVARPREDTGSIESEIRSVLRKRDRQAKLLDDEGDVDLQVVVNQVRQHERRLKELRKQLAEAKSRNEPTPPPLTAADVEGVLADLRGVLAQDVATAAPVLRKLTGPVVVDLVLEEGKTSRPTWTARFAVNLAPVAVEVTAANCPTRRTWEYLHSRSWTMGESIVAEIGARNVPGKFIGRVAAMVDAGFELEKAAEVLGITTETARESLEHADDVEAAVGPAGVRGTERAEYIGIAAEVARRRDKCGEKVAAIAVDLEVTVGTVARAYAFARRSGLSKPSDKYEGPRPRAGLGVEKHRKIVRLLEAGEKPDAVAEKVGCGVTTVRSTARLLKAMASAASTASSIAPDGPEASKNAGSGGSAIVRSSARRLALSENREDGSTQSKK